VARRILLVTYFYPPDPSVGSHRWSALTRYLRRMGHEVTVITTSAFGTLPDDGAQVLRTADIFTSPTLRRLLRRPPLTTDGALPSVVVPPPRLVRDGPVPDAWLLTWLPFVLVSARRLLRSREYDCLVTSGPPDSTHLLGLLLGWSRPAWVADFEEGWRFDQLREAWPTRLQDRIDCALEAWVARSADRLVAVTMPIVDDFTRRFGVCADHVSMAWDPDLEEQFSSARPPELETDRINIVYTGTLTLPHRRDPRGLIAALRELAVSYPEDASRIRLVLAGSLSEQERQLVNDMNRDGLVRHVGALRHRDAVALQRRADALLLLTSGDHGSQITGKIFEYLAANRPIIAVASDNAAARLVRETNTGVVVAPDDVQAIVGALRAATSGQLASRFQPRGLERYRYPGPAEAFAESVEHAIASHQARRLRRTRALKRRPGPSEVRR
jgi:glycosyltransferase involved in cell wall biosynthesis